MSAETLEAWATRSGGEVDCGARYAMASGVHRPVPRRSQDAARRVGDERVMLARHDVGAPCTAQLSSMTPYLDSAAEGNSNSRCSGIHRRWRASNERRAPNQREIGMASGHRRELELDVVESEELLYCFTNAFLGSREGGWACGQVLPRRSQAESHELGESPNGEGPREGLGEQLGHAFSAPRRRRRSNPLWTIAVLDDFGEAANAPPHRTRVGGVDRMNSWSDALRPPWGARRRRAFEDLEQRLLHTFTERR